MLSFSNALYRQSYFEAIKNAIHLELAICLLFLDSSMALAKR